MRIVVSPAESTEVVMTVPGPQGPAGESTGISYQSVSGGDYVETSGRIFIGKDFPTVFPDGSIFFREI